MKRMQALSTLCLAAALMAVLQGCASTAQADAQSVAMAEDVERVPVPFVQPEEIDLSQDAKAASVQRKGYRFKTPIEATVTVERRADGWLLMRVSQERVKGLPPALAERRDMQNAQRMALRAAALYVAGMLVPIDHVALRLAWRTLLLAVFVLVVVRRDLPALGQAIARRLRPNRKNI